MQCMTEPEFPKIQRGNGVSNDALATLAEIMEASHRKVSSLENKIEEMNNESAPREKNSYTLLIISVVIALLSLYTGFSTVTIIL